MDTTFMNSENSGTSYPHRLLLNLTDEINLNRSDDINLNRSDHVPLWNVSVYYTWKNIKNSYKSNKFTISSPTWNEELELPDGLYSRSDIQDYFEYIFKNMIILQ